MRNYLIYNFRYLKSLITQEMAMLKDLLTVAQGLNNRFPEGSTPFQIMTRLLEESGELAQQVNIFEGTGIKREKNGPPDRQKMAKEVKDVLLCALQVCLYYGIEEEVEATLQWSYQRLTAEGHIRNESQ
jgi:NTP pyrophosphatase (non-canonical NTP hydrolase)